MTKNETIVMKQLPESSTRSERRAFLADVRQLARDSYRPQLILDLPMEKIGPETLDLLLDCAEQVEKAEGRVSVAGASPEVATILELTQLTSVVNVFPSVSEAVGMDGVYGFDGKDPDNGRQTAA
jgi:anti-anti-sigma regulatory factor